MNRFPTTKVILCLVGGFLAVGMLLAQGEAPLVPNGSRVPNWTVPPFHAQSASGGLTTMADISEGAFFVAMAPCRVFDTRGAVGPFGGPRLAANVTRNFDIDSGPCTGIPNSAAYSMNFGAILPDGANSFITIWPAGATMPTVSAINPLQGTVIANSAIIGAGTGGAISVRPNTGVDLYGDINGYFVDYPGPSNDETYLDWAGNTTGSFMIIRNENTTAAGGDTAAIQGVMSTTQAIPGVVIGNQQAATGANSAVLGRNSSASSNAAGVRGYGGAVPGTWTHAGVRGESNNGGTGVFGLVSNGAGEGVTGFMISTAGAVLSGSHLGFTSTTGLSTIGDTTATGTKFFVEPHPTDASKIIRYISLEGPEAGTYFRGKGRFQNGVATIDVPETFRTVTDPEGLSIQVTPIGEMATVAVQSIGLDRIVVRGSRNVEFFYTVNGIRRAYKDVEIVAPNEKIFVPDGPDASMPLWLTEEAKRRLITNGTYRPDGMVNMETAHRLGWDRVWEARARPQPQPELPTTP
jgi:hypothetical protein